MKKTLVILANCLFVGYLAIPTQMHAEDAVSGIRTIGARSCNAWAKDREDEFSWPAIANRNWLVGFLSGIAIGSNNDFLRGADIPALIAWVDAYCADHPQKFADEAAIALAQKLVNKERIRNPSSADSSKAY